jgi:OFA family oxalate/formate antiporter-like MFS transporter
MYSPYFQLVSSLISMIMIANLQYGWTLFVNPIRDAHAWQLSEIQGAFAFFILLQTWVQPLDGWFIDRVGPRRFITAAGILCGIGWSAMGYATTLAQLYFFYGLAGIGAAFVYSGCIGSALKWFPTRRGFASGVIAAGFGGGTSLFVPVISYLIRDYSYQAAFLATGIFQGVIITIVAQFLRHPGPEFTQPAKASAATSPTKSRRNNENFTTKEMLSTPHFYVLYLMFVAMGTGGLFVTSNSGALVRSWGMTVAVGVVFGSCWTRKHNGDRVSFAGGLPRFCCDRRTDIWRDVHTHLGPDVLHVGRDLLAFPVYRRRLLRQQVRHIELWLPLQR